MHTMGGKGRGGFGLQQAFSADALSEVVGLLLVCIGEFFRLLTDERSQEAACFFRVPPRILTIVFFF